MPEKEARRIANAFSALAELIVGVAEAFVEMATDDPEDKKAKAILAPAVQKARRVLSDSES